MSEVFTNTNTENYIIQDSMENKGVNKSCLNCGKKFIDLTHNKSKKHCSDKCRNKYKNTILKEIRGQTHKKNCKFCGSEFETKLSHKEYCSSNCIKYAFEERNKDLVSNRRKDYRKNQYYKNHNKTLEYAKNWRKENLSRIKFYQKKFYEQNIEDMRKRSLNWHFKNRERSLIKIKNWKENNKDHIREYSRKYLKKLKKDNPSFKILCNLRIRLNYLVSKEFKTSKTIDLIGCTLDDLKKHLESQFKEGMNWGNYGEWHVDHIIPCSLFDFTKKSDQFECFHYTNLQPLWAIENLKKGNRMEVDK